MWTVQSQDTPPSTPFKGGIEDLPARRRLVVRTRQSPVAEYETTSRTLDPTHDLQGTGVRIRHRLAYM